MEKIFLLLILLIDSNFVLAAGFDCTKASNTVEKLVCSDKKLSQLDDELTDVYKQAVKNSPELKKEQINWLKTVRKCKDIDCITNLYDSRLLELGSLVETISDESNVSEHSIEDLSITRDVKPDISSSSIKKNDENKEKIDESITPKNQKFIEIQELNKQRRLERQEEIDERIAKANQKFIERQELNKQRIIERQEEYEKKKIERRQQFENEITERKNQELIKIKENEKNIKLRKIEDLITVRTKNKQEISKLKLELDNKTFIWRLAKLLKISGGIGISFFVVINILIFLTLKPDARFTTGFKGNAKPSLIMGGFFLVSIIFYFIGTMLS